MLNELWTLIQVLSAFGIFLIIVVLFQEIGRLARVMKRQNLDMLGL